MVTKEPIPLSEQQMKEVKAAFDKQEVVVASLSEVKHLLIGLQGEGGKFLGLASLVDFDWERRKIKIVTKVDPEKIASLQLGYIKVNPQGEEEGWVKPWSI